jgi:hypothetical protein
VLESEHKIVAGANRGKKIINVLGEIRAIEKLIDDLRQMLLLGRPGRAFETRREP